MYAREHSSSGTPRASGVALPTAPDSPSSPSGSARERSEAIGRVAVGDERPLPVQEQELAALHIARERAALDQQQQELAAREQALRKRENELEAVLPLAKRARIAADTESAESSDVVVADGGAHELLAEAAARLRGPLDPRHHDMIAAVLRPDERQRWAGLARVMLKSLQSDGAGRWIDSAGGMALYRTDPAAWLRTLPPALCGWATQLSPMTRNVSTGVASHALAV